MSPRRKTYAASVQSLRQVPVAALPGPGSDCRWSWSAA